MLASPLDVYDGPTAPHVEELKIIRTIFNSLWTSCSSGVHGDGRGTKILFHHPCFDLTGVLCGRGDENCALRVLTSHHGPVKDPCPTPTTALRPFSLHRHTRHGDHDRQNKADRSKQGKNSTA